MKYKKSMIIIMLAIFLFAIAAAGASDVDDISLASEDTGQIELSTDNKIIEDNLQANQKDAQLTQSGNNETVSAENELDILSEGEGTYTDLINEIGDGGDKYLTKSYYRYDSGNTIEIKTSGVIDGNGAIIDMNGSTIRAFYVSGSDVTIKNLTIKNANYNGNGGAIYFSSSGTVTNCNFTDNHANYGGAILFEGTGNVTNCNFTNNSASGGGGAINMGSGTVTNCNFTDNQATYYGGAVYFRNNGEVTNCNFADNSANQGGAIYSQQWYTAADTCIFKRNSGEDINIVIYPPTLNVDNFTTFYGSGEKLTFDLKTNSSIPVTNGNISISVYFKDNDSWVGNYSCLSGKGWIPELSVGSYYAIFNTEYAEFQPINRTIKIIPNIPYYVNVTSLTTHNKTVNITAKSNIPQDILEGKLLFILPNSTEINATYGSNGTWWALHTFDDYAVYQVNASYDGLDNVTINNTTINITKADSTMTVDNVTLNYGDSTNLTVTTEGATGIKANINGTNVTVINNYTIPISVLGAGNYALEVTTIPDGDHNPVTKTATITVNKINSTLTVGDIVFGYGDEGSGDVSFTGASEVIANVVNQPKAVVNVKGNKIAVSGLAAGTYTLNVTTVPDGNHTAVTETATITVNKVNSSLTVDDVELDYGESKNVTVAAEGAIGITAEIDGVNVIVNDFIVLVSDLKAGTYTLTVTTVPDENHTAVTETAAITVNKVNSTLTVGDIVFGYGSEGSGDVSFTGASEVIANVVNQPKAVVNVKGNKIAVSGLAAGTYTLNVTTVPDENHTAVTETATITVNKVNSTLTFDNVELDYGESKNVNVTATGATGITAKIDGVNVTVNNFIVLVSDLKAGTYTLTVTTVPDENHTAVTETATITVNKVNSTLTFDNVELDYGESKNVNVAATGATGITAKIDGVNVTVNDFIVPVSDLAAGNYNLTVTTIPDENHTAVTKTAAITVNKVNSTLTVDDVELDYGESKNVNVAATGATGITAKIDGVNVTVNDFIVPVSDLAVGNYNLTVTTIPDENHTAVTETAAITVNKVNSTLTVDDVELDYGESKNVTVTTEGATGITAKIDGVDVSVNNFIVPVSDLKAGNYTLTVTTIPDENHIAVTETATITVNKVDSTLTVPAVSFDYGDSGSSEVEFTGATGVVAVVNDLYAVVEVSGKTITVSNLTAGTYILTVTTIPDNNHNEVTKTAGVTVLKQNANVNVSMPENITVGENSTVNVVLPVDASGNVVAKVDGEIVDNVTVADGSADLTIPSLTAGNHTVEIAYSGDGNYNSDLKTAAINVGRDSTNITAADVSTTYKISKYLVIKLTDSRGNPLTNTNVTVELSTAKNYTTDENGQIQVKISNLVPKTYTAKITFNGNENYAGSNTTAEVTVKKATSKITAKAKTFKTTTKTKKYTVMLKANGKALKNKWVYLKVNGKTYKAKTNSKGKATFKITQLNKAGKFKATVTFKGNDYYKKATKKATIKVKSVWKTVQKGSKNSAIVKKIQRALKNHGYYLEYNGRYLMVDGIFWDYTEMAVREFQNDKTLKVTGKVDEKTAKKLGII